MLAPVRHLMDNKRIVLASASPRRKELIHILGINAAPYPSKFLEDLNPADFASVSQYVEATALGKAEEVYNRLAQPYGGIEEPNNYLIISADTVVTLDGEIYGKPKDEEDAFRMLTNLSGRCNRVYTSVVLRYFEGSRKFTEVADVYFGELSKEQIKAYIHTGHPMDKAGAYGINGAGGALISKIDGDYYCVMGLPMHRLCCELFDLFVGGF